MSQLEEWITLIEDCENREQQLTDWERTFIDGLRRQLEAGRGLSASQSSTLDDIWEKVT